MAFDAYLKIDGVTGECTDSKHAQWMEIYSFSFGMSNPATVGSGTTGSGAGKPSLSSFNVMKKTETASVALCSALVKGSHFATATVELCKSGGTKETYLTYRFEEVFVDSIQWSGSAGGDDVPTESASFSFGKVEWEYYPQGADGKLGTKVGPMSWDLRTNVGG